MYCEAVRAGKYVAGRAVMVGLGAILVAMIGLRPARAEKQPEPPDDTARRAVEALLEDSTPSRQDEQLVLPWEAG